MDPKGNRTKSLLGERSVGDVKISYNQQTLLEINHSMNELDLGKQCMMFTKFLAYDLWPMIDVTFMSNFFLCKGSRT